MKSLIVLSLVFLAACSSTNESVQTQSATAPTEQKAEVLVADTDIQPSSELIAEQKQKLIAEGKQLIKGSDCFTCHAIDQKKIGPSYKDVAKKYKGQDQMIDQLAQKIIKGGSGVWGIQRMTAHPQLSLDDARKMVRAVLSLGE